MANRASNYKASATEFGRRLTALYKLRFFPRLGKEFSEKLFASGVAAGANISALGSITDAENKIRVATDAIVSLNETAFAAQVMVEGGYYTAAETAPLNAYIEKLIEALSNLISSVKERKLNDNKGSRPRTQRVVVEQKPIVNRRVIVQTDEAVTVESGEIKTKESKPAVEEGKPPIVIDIPDDPAEGVPTDPDGFNAPYKK